jgi:hypothetical protein
MTRDRGEMVRSNQKRAGRGGRVPSPRRLVDEEVFTGSRERVEGGIVRSDRMHPAHLIAGVYGPKPANGVALATR